MKNEPAGFCHVFLHLPDLAKVHAREPESPPPRKANRDAAIGAIPLVRKLARLGPLAVMLALVSALAWFGTRPSGTPAAKASPRPSVPGGCQPVEGTLGSGPPTLTTSDWEVSVKEARVTDVLGFEGGETHAEGGKVFVVGGLTFTRIGSAGAEIRSDDLSIVCAGGGGMTPGYWSQDGKQFCFPCSFELGIDDPSTVIWFAFKVERQRATRSFAVDYEGAGPFQFGPP